MAYVWSKNTCFIRLADQSVGLLDQLLNPNLDEDQKIDVLSKRTGSLFMALLNVLAILTVAIGLPWLALDSVTRYGPLEGANIWLLLTAISVGMAIPFLWPKPKSRSEFGVISQLFHRIAFNHYHLVWRLHTREVQRSQISPRPDFLIITGLARAGTTAMLNTLSKNPAFASLSYANLPFLLSPSTWGRLYKPKGTNERERSHGDGLKISTRSVEALEEFFFKVRLKDSFIHEDYLSAHDVDADVAKEYLNYQSLVRKSDDQVYLAKNNNFMLRYASMRRHLPQMRVIIMFRDPLTHAASLMEKHMQFSEMQDADPFVLTYMDWLGHHEFGQGHKPFAFSTEDNPYSPDCIDYWLTLWIQYYRYVLTQDLEGCQWVAYEDFAEHPLTIAQELLTFWGVGTSNLPLQTHTKKRQVSTTCDDDLLNEARTIYSKLYSRSVNIK